MPRDGMKCSNCTARFSGKDRYKAYQKHYADKHFKSKKKAKLSGTYKKPAFARKR